MTGRDEPYCRKKHGIRGRPHELQGLDISVQQFSSVLFRILKSAQYGKDIRSLKSEFL